MITQWQHLSLLAAELCEGIQTASSTPNTKLNTPHCTARTMGKKTTLFVGMLLKDKQQAVCFVKQWYNLEPLIMRYTLF
jgi:hypothetical protein